MKNKIIQAIFLLIILLMPICIVKGDQIPDADVTVTSWSDLQTEINNAGSSVKVIKLGGNIVAPTPTTGQDINVVSGKNIILDLNGYVIDRGLAPNGPVDGDNGSVIKVHGSLTIVDGNPNAIHKGTLSANNVWTWDGGNDTGDTTIKGGIITGGSRTYKYNGGSGIRVYQSANLTMNGGTIAGNKSANMAHGGGIYVSYGTVNMQGGEICYNFADLHGGGVFIRGGSFTMGNTAKISNNSVSSNGGGLYLMTDGNGSFTMNGGEISYNKAKDGGGARIESSMTITGGVIKNNTATNDGGGVRGGVIMSGGEIVNNTATNNGGGVRGSSTITGGKISGNTSKNGGGYYGNLTMTGGEITGNTATSNGGGLYAETVTLGGNAVISGNLKDTAKNNVYLPSGKVLTISTDVVPTSKMNIGVNTEVAPVDGTPVAVTANGAEENTKLFFSDNKDYEVRYNTDHIDLYVHHHNYTGDYIEYDKVNHKWAKKCSCGEFDVEHSLTGVDIPKAVANLVYNGEELIGVKEGIGYTIKNNKAKEVGNNYKAVATLEEGYIWSDGSLDPKEITWSIVKKEEPKEELKEEKNPDTKDNIIIWSSIVLISSLGILTSFVLNKKIKTNN